MHYFNQVLYGQPQYNSFDSYYLPWYDSSYRSDGPYGEPLQCYQEGLYNESNLAYEEAGDGFLSGSWYSGYRQADQVYNTVELLNNGGSNWIDEYKSYFASCWEDDVAPHGYWYEDHKGSLEKAETNEDGNREGAHSVDLWSGYHFELVDGIKDNFSIRDEPNQQPENNNEDPWDYARLCESIYGYWPCFHRLDEECPPDLLLTYSL